MLTHGTRVLWSLVLAACGAERSGEAVLPDAAPVPVDHHAHILSPQLVADWKALGVPFSRPDSVYTSAGALLAVPHPGARRAVLVPMGHLYGRQAFRDELGLSPAEEQRRVRHENDHVAAEAARHAGRALALCSVPPLRPYARDELRRCRDSLGSAGIKLHLGSAGADLRQRATVDSIGHLLGWAAGSGLPVLLHVDPQRRGHDTTHMRQFIERAIAPHGELVVVVAHLGGSGGYGEWPRSVFQAFAAWNARQVGDGHAQVYFDLSAVWLDEESEGVPASTPAQGRQLADDLRRAGLDRVVLGSDYPVFDPRHTAASLRAHVPLASAEWDTVLAAVVPGWGREPSSSASPAAPEVP